MNKTERLLADGTKLDKMGQPILFYKPSDEYGLFSNFSQHSITLPSPWSNETITYKTGEHRFQAMKGADQVSHDYVVDASTPTHAKSRGGPRSKLVFRNDWGNNVGDLCWYVMLEICMVKAIQHGDVWSALYNALGKRIYEDSPTDDIWGWRFGNDYSGKNLLGRCWMQTRDFLDMI